MKKNIKKKKSVADHELLDLSSWPRPEAAAKLFVEGEITKSAKDLPGRNQYDIPTQPHPSCRFYQDKTR